MPSWRVAARVAACAMVVVLAAGVLAAPREPFPLDADAQRWVQQTLARMTLDDKVGQLVVPSFDTAFTSTDSDQFESLANLVRRYHVGGFLLFGATEPIPSVALDPHYGGVVLGQVMAAASLTNRLQALSTIPLLNSADFEAGIGFRLAGGTVFPRQMAFGAAREPRYVREAAAITAAEARAVGVHVNFAPLADVNNNPRNPVINTRSYGEDPKTVGALVSAYVAGAREGGAIATVKHFPGHGDTDTDTHIGLATIPHARERLDQVEFVPFRLGFDAGVEAVMTSHIAMPTLDPTPGLPTTFSEPIITGLLRREFGFKGLIFTDSMSMDGVARQATPAEAAVRTVLAGSDQVLHSPDPAAAFDGLKAAVTAGRISAARLDESVTRILRAKASLGLHRQKLVSLDKVADTVGGRTPRALAREVAEHAVTLIKDERGQVPLRVPRDTPVLYLSILDYPSGWRIAAPSRTFIPELKKHWPQVTAIELSDHTPASEVDLVRTIAPRYGAIVVSVFVRAASGSGRMDLAPELTRLLQSLARSAERSGTPMVTTFFGNPYVSTFVPELPAVLLTYDFYDLPETAAVSAIAGDSAISGHLPIALPGMFPVGHGLERPARRAGAGQ